MKTSSIRAFGVAAFAITGLLVGCGGAPEDMEAQQNDNTQVSAPAQEENNDRPVHAKYFRWVCAANTVGLRYSPGGAVFAQINYGEGVEVYSRDGNWMYVQRLSNGQWGWTDATYFCV
ncbi:hypothetical protein [Corallococcus carmarthensis]|uniref:SH3 domain-containing protein n=1 Tax=Corallococcus carmarthensis TaxID=2316728 RepID=A0A3A8JVM0_9BACT|nr:hypothetical protein [Corallococcus carmarthensis]NOK19746.1 hypothetical protein [Corallococcus carmarthensis]RKG99942.1 hypothetical protein D7X32_25045 [Corallococcus carmarthensis]